MEYYNRGGIILSTSKINTHDDLHLVGIGIINLCDTTKSVHLEGIFKNISEINCNIIHTEGYLYSKFGINAKAFIKSEGRLTTNGTIKSDKMILYGSLQCEELYVNEIKFYISGNSSVKKTVCDSISVDIKKYHGNFKGKLKISHINIESIRATQKIELASSTCNEIEAPIVIIGNNCHINKVKYTDALIVNDGAIVDIVEKYK